MATLQKIVYTYWKLDGRRVPTGTPGATKVREESTKWYMVYWEGKKLKKKPLSTDKDVAQAMMGDRLRDRELGRGEMVDPRKHHLERPILEHFEEYLAEQDGELDDFYFDQKRRIVRLIVAETGMVTLADLTHGAIDAYLTGMKKRRQLKSGKTAIPASAATRKKHLTAIHSFAEWCEKKDRVERNPLYRVTVPKGKEVRPRRALSEDELRRLLEEARERPLRTAQSNRGGRGNKGGKAIHQAKVRPEVRERLILLGRERALIYKTAVFTGLRADELRHLKVAHLNLDATLPTYELLGKYTKNVKPAKGALLPEFAEQLRRFIADTGKGGADPVFTVPEKMCKIFKRDLRAAGIPLQDHEGRYATFHSLRHSANTLLGLAGVPARLRMTFMRHSDIRLTLHVYDDEAQYSLKDAVDAFAKLNLP